MFAASIPVAGTTTHVCLGEESSLAVKVASVANLRIAQASGGLHSIEAFSPRANVASLFDHAASGNAAMAIAVFAG